MDTTPSAGPPPALPPGWYPDNNQAHTVRYWDGATWTDQTAPAPTPAHPFSQVPQNPMAAKAAMEIRDNGLFTAGVLTALLFPIVGFIIGIVLMSRNNDKGIWVMLGSIVAAVGWFFFFSPR